MTKPASLIHVLVCTLLLCIPASAQTLKEGRWSGSISPPSGGTFEIWYEVAGMGDSLSVTMFIPQADGANAIPLEDLAFDDEGSLTFAYRGREIRCRLSPFQPVGYAGECTSDTRPGSARLTMTPLGDGGE